MNPYSWLFAALYDRALAGAERHAFRAHRRELVARAGGRVLELGAGTGANLPFYPKRLDGLVLTEPDRHMARRLGRRLSASPVVGRPALAGAEALPFADGTFDTVVRTLVLCTVGDPQRALRESRRVLRPGGELLLLEHVRSSKPRFARWQDRLNRPWNWIGHGCNCNRPTLDYLRDAAFEVTRPERHALPLRSGMAPIVRPYVVGSAVPR
jgi:ubiquinone/menaquinone biosynthesis C-methylase UbiE